ncbi:MAG: hypothetical protein ABI947_03375 [Chloroflexota bacterium]
MPNFVPHMPTVDDVSDLAARFAVAREVTAGITTLLEDEPALPGQRYIVVMTPGRMLMQQPCPFPGSIPPDLVASVEEIASTETPLNITVIALNEVPALLTNFSETIPFFGYLLGLGYVGHNVTVFEGHPSALAIGCADANLLIVDSEMIPHLQADWREVAFDQGNATRLLIFHRDGRLEEIFKG